MLCFDLGWKRAEKGEGNARGEEEGGVAVTTSIGRPVLRMTICCLMGMEEEEAEATVVEGEDMDNGWVRRGVDLGGGGLWRRKASTVVG